jgi:hypothetical protein
MQGPQTPIGEYFKIVYNNFQPVFLRNSLFVNPREVRGIWMGIVYTNGL